MKAAVVTAFDEAPHYQEFSTPTPSGPEEVLIDVLAAGLHPRVRSQANGSHYTSTDELPLVPGIDGVGRTEDGKLRYFILPDTNVGAMADRTVIDVRRSVELPDDSDPIEVAAAMNPAMSSWVALRRRIEFEVGQSVMVMAATGNAGHMAIQIAKYLGASNVVAVGRGAERLRGLAALGADNSVSLDDSPEVIAANLGEAAKDVDIVIDYLWGKPTSDAIYAIVPKRTDDAQTLTWIHIGSVAGPESSIPAAALRAVKLQIVGSGQGSVSPRDILSELPQLAAEINKGTFRINARSMMLADVEQAWAEAATSSTERIVLIP